MTRVLVVGGSDAGVSAAVRAREVDPESEVHMLVADRWPNYSICGLPYLLSGEVSDPEDLAHRPGAEMSAAGLQLHLEHRAVDVDARERSVMAETPEGRRRFEFDQLILATGAAPRLPPIDGLDADGVHLLHTMDDALALGARLADPSVHQAVIVGAGYIGLEMADALRRRDLEVTIVELLPEVMPTVDIELGALVRGELERNGVDVLKGTSVSGVESTRGGLAVQTSRGGLAADVVLVVAGVRPDVELGVGMGLATGAGGAIAVDERMAAGSAGIWAAGDCVHTHHRLLESPTYRPLGSTAHKQGRVAGENAVGGEARFSGVIGTQVVKVFDFAIAATGLRDSTAPADLYRPFTHEISVPDRNRYYPGASELVVRISGDTLTGRLLGAQIVGGLDGQVAKRIDIVATAIHSGMRVENLNELDLSYTPPFSSPWDPIQQAAQAWKAAVPTTCDRAAQGDLRNGREPACHARDGHGR